MQYSIRSFRLQACFAATTRRENNIGKKNSLTRSFKTNAGVLFSMFYFLTRGCFSDAKKHITIFFRS